MPSWILQLILAVIPLIGKLIEKWVPGKITPKREFRSKKRAMEFCGKTQEQIRQIGIRKGWIKEAKP